MTVAALSSLQARFRRQALACALAVAGLCSLSGAAAPQSFFGVEQPRAKKAAKATHAALNDPRVRDCLALALRNQDPKVPPYSSAVEQAAALFDAEVLHQAVAACRTALAAFPGERKVIVAEYLAAEALSLLLFGLSDVPASDEAAFGQALVLAYGESDTGIFVKSLSFFLGSAHEYGVGTKADRTEAIRWYAKAAEAGDAVSRRAHARLVSEAPPPQ